MILLVNDVQKKSIDKLKKLLPTSHYVDLVVRHNGKNINFQADWIKELLKMVIIQDYSKHSK